MVFGCSGVLDLGFWFSDFGFGEAKEGKMNQGKEEDVRSDQLFCLFLYVFKANIYIKYFEDFEDLWRKLETKQSTLPQHQEEKEEKRSLFARSFS